MNEKLAQIIDRQSVKKLVFDLLEFKYYYSEPEDKTRLMNRLEADIAKLFSCSEVEACWKLLKVAIAFSEREFDTKGVEPLAGLLGSTEILGHAFHPMTFGDRYGMDLPKGVRQAAENEMSHKQIYLFPDGRIVEDWNEEVPVVEDDVETGETQLWHRFRIWQVVEQG